MLPLSKNERNNELQRGGFFSKEERIKNTMEESVEATRQLQQQVMALEPTPIIEEEEASSLPQI